ncbi:hypothetical protein SAMN04487948_14413 [Halogranum amylolyticum]|uniref:Uncharacterized protein n=1 Tax=Halogranum amylolyticum TaxID=660520 RepID=A0A1H8WUH7_9EURY|nr:hypothetical protein [Halogranum amylolyticum]SEP31330.1 hypothetical protein SAMN04487948_14413 [Halogranum amylolyticum]
MLAILVATFVSLPGALMWVGVVLSLLTGLIGGLVTGRFTSGGWHTRAIHGLVTGLLGGFLFGVTLWFSMSSVVPRITYSIFWGFNYLLATNPIGISQLPWLYTGNTLMVPLILLSMGLFAVEGYIASGAASRSHRASVRVYLEGSTAGTA